MYRRYSRTPLILAIVVGLVLTPLMVAVDAQARITFMSDRDGNFEIYVMDNDGKNQRRLTNNGHIDSSPSWSPDSNHIVFFSNRDGHIRGDSPELPTFDIYVMDADGRNQQRLTNNPHDDGSPSWSPDGKRIAFTRAKDEHFNSDIYVMDTDGRNQQRLTNNPHDDGSPSWSPDGKRIVFSSKRDGHFIGEFGITSEIYLMDADGRNQHRLTENRKNDESPSWSPDGKRIAFSTDREEDGSKEIYVMEADGTNPRNLTKNHQNDFSPEWFNPR